MPWRHARHSLRLSHHLLPSKSDWLVVVPRCSPQLSRASGFGAKLGARKLSFQSGLCSAVGDDGGSSSQKSGQGNTYTQDVQNDIASTFENLQDTKDQEESNSPQHQKTPKKPIGRKRRKTSLVSTLSIPSNRRADEENKETFSLTDQRPAAKKAQEAQQSKQSNKNKEQISSGKPDKKTTSVTSKANKKTSSAQTNADKKTPSAETNAKKTRGRTILRKSPHPPSFRKFRSYRIRKLACASSDIRTSTAQASVARRRGPGIVRDLQSLPSRHYSAPPRTIVARRIDSKKRRRIGAVQAGKRLIRKHKSERRQFQIRRPNLPLVGKHAYGNSLNRARQLPSYERQTIEKLGGKDKTIIGPAFHTSDAAKLRLMPISVPTPPVPSLAYGLERVLFNPGIHQLQDPRSRVYNFDPYLQTIMPINEFNFDALKKYITSSEDSTLRDIAQQNGKKYVGSTSSMTGILTHFHYLLSQWRPLNMNMLSRGFPVASEKVTELLRAPSVIFLRYQDGTYAIDADKEFDKGNVLMLLGKSMEKLLCLKPNEYEKYRKSSPEEIPEEDRTAPESYHYSTLGDFLMRSQLDTHDARLPGTGMFDLKTRAVVSIRMDVSNHEAGTGYEIKQTLGAWESYEREYYDMIRAAFLKYSLQVRMGRMDGVFVAHHNIERIFGFQYIGIDEMDQAIHGQRDTVLGDREFLLSVDLLNRVMNRAIEKFPETSIRLHFETREAVTPFMYIFAEPFTEDQVEEVQSRQKAFMNEFEQRTLELTSSDQSDQDKSQSHWEEMEASIQDTMKRDEQGVEEETLDLQSPSQEVEDGKATRLRNSDNASLPTYNYTLSTYFSKKQDRVDRTLPSDFDPYGDFDVDADRPFLETINQESVNTDSQVLAMTLTIRNKVNNEYVVRPSKLRSDDSWEVEYSLVEREEATKAHALYQACKARRRKKMAEPAANVENFSQYVQNLRRMSMEGRRWRQSMDEKDRARPLHVLGEP